MPLSRLLKAKASILQKTSLIPEIGVVLGSGLGYLADLVEDAITIPYCEIEHFPLPSIQGHQGSLILGRLQGKSVAFLSGRVHLYEGYSTEEVVFPIRLLKLLGIKTLFLTNAAGGINLSFLPGDLMLIRDHINLTGRNPLVGPNIDVLGQRFPDMTQAYDPLLQDLAFRCADEMGFSLQVGVYLGTLGPSYETPAEIRFFRTIGADAVGMSTVLETVAARHAGIKVLGISCISNLAAGDHPGELTHEEVTLVTQKSRQAFGDLLQRILAKVESA